MVQLTIKKCIRNAITIINEKRQKSNVRNEHLLFATHVSMRDTRIIVSFYGRI